MKSFFIIAPIAAASSFEDPCARLCTFDGPTVCTEGSHVVFGGTCHRYLHGGPHGDYCYFTVEHQDLCPASGRMVRASEVDDLIAARLASSVRGIALTAPRELSATEKIAFAIERIPPYSASAGSTGREDEELSLAVHAKATGFLVFEQARDRWENALGGRLVRLAEENIQTRPALIRPLLILAGNICSMPMVNREIFFLLTNNFFTKHSDAITDFVREFYRARQGRIATTFPQRRLEAFLISLIHVMPSLMQYPDLSSIVLHERLIERTQKITTSFGRARVSRFEVPRSEAFIYSLENLTSSLAVLSTGVTANFWGENGSGPGVARDWFTEVANQIYSPLLGLFEQRTSEQPNYMQLSPSPLFRGHISMIYKAVGGFLALALISQQQIRLAFPLSFYKALLEQDVTLEDLQVDEPALYNSLVYIKSLTTDQELADYEITIDGVTHQFTTANRIGLIRVKINSLVDPAVRGNLKLIVNAFREIVGRAVLEGFTAQSLRDMLVGDASFDVDDMLNNVIMEGYTRNSPQIQWLEKLLREWSPEKRQKFWRFCSSSTQVPIGGFASLSEAFKIQRYGSPDSLPTASTCYNTFKLPEYPSEDDLRRKVSLAIDADASMGLV